MRCAYCGEPAGQLYDITASLCLCVACAAVVYQRHLKHVLQVLGCTASFASVNEVPTYTFVGTGPARRYLGRIDDLGTIDLVTLASIVQARTARRGQQWVQR
jgi:hypothetical protein